MATPQYALPVGSLILVTGANGYIGSHVADVLLGLKYRVRGTAREDKPWLNELFETKYGKGAFESFVLRDMQDESDWELAMRGIDGVVHVAGDVSMNTDPSVVIPQTQQATRNILNAAAKNPQIQRFVLTSSSSAAIIPKANVKGAVIDQSTYNDEAVAAAWSNETPEVSKGYAVYAAAKTEGERAAWEWNKDTNPGFVLNTVLPNYNVGEILVPKYQHGSTMGFVRSFWKDNYFAFDTMPPQYYVHVRDCARLHTVALLDSAIKNERIFAFAYEFNWTDVIRILRTLRPNKTFQDPPKNEGRDYTVVTGRERAESLLKSFFGQDGWVDLETGLAEGIEDLD
ncbi:cinnamoyl-CoA reductase [Sporothrix brasiliensis 5110]|uniref:Cinnamoyl-CoA reductase n=1 Tax=Sporothrix brasiliensis 5110 TaxID=1398154 RepID=A0A0C2F4I2_9PEZI|nr:cinnamoyl-CoA reductase [Sporothrix brasiliensis 5110]KIH93809.1 cinnamoyl-CoA reductase [Sporothrix brasiliensis 5110]